MGIFLGYFGDLDGETVRTPKFVLVYIGSSSCSPCHLPCECIWWVSKMHYFWIKLRSLPIFNANLDIFPMFPINRAIFPVKLDVFIHFPCKKPTISIHWMGRCRLRPLASKEWTHRGRLAATMGICHVAWNAVLERTRHETVRFNGVYIYIWYPPPKPTFFTFVLVFTVFYVDY